MLAFVKGWADIFAHRKDANELGKSWLNARISETGRAMPGLVSALGEEPIFRLGDRIRILTRSYRARAVSEPRAVLAEFGTIIPDDVEIRVSDSTAIVRYLVLPRRPEGTEGYSEEQLAALVTRDTMIGVVPVSLDTGRANR
jgi:hypothetical protein